MSDIEELKRQGLCMRAISKLTGFESQNDLQVSAEAGRDTGVWTATGAGEQTGRVQAIPRGAAKAPGFLLRPFSDTVCFRRSRPHFVRHSTSNDLRALLHAIKQ